MQLWEQLVRNILVLSKVVLDVAQCGGNVPHEDHVRGCGLRACPEQIAFPILYGIRAIGETAIAFIEGTAESSGDRLHDSRWELDIRLALPTNAFGID